MQPFLCQGSSAHQGHRFTDVAIMKKLVKLQNEVNSLKSYAIELESSISKVDDDSVVFPEKQSVITTMKNVSLEMRQAAELLNGISENNSDSEIVSSRDTTVLNFLKSNFETFQKNHEKLSVVLGELVRMWELDGTGVDVYLLHYISDVMESLRTLIEETKDIEYTSESQ